MRKNTIILGDTHGGFDAIVNTLMAAGAIDRAGEKNPDWRVVHVGDLANMAPQGRDFRGFISEDLETLAFADTVIDDLVVGNHEVFYSHGLPMGWKGMAEFHELHPDLLPFMHGMVRRGKYVAAVEVDGMLVTHAGLHPKWLAYRYPNDPVKVAEMLNDELIQAVMDRDAHVGKYPAILDGDGIFWLRPQVKGMPDGRWTYGQKTEYTQVVGHTPDWRHPRYIKDRNVWLIDTGGYALRDNPSVGALIKREGDREFSPFFTFTEDEGILGSTFTSVENVSAVNGALDWPH